MQTQGIYVTENRLKVTGANCSVFTVAQNSTYEGLTLDKI